MLFCRNFKFIVYGAFSCLHRGYLGLQPDLQNVWIPLPQQTWIPYKSQHFAGLATTMTWSTWTTWDKRMYKALKQEEKGYDQCQNNH